jgi:hypothetical protein
MEKEDYGIRVYLSFFSGRPDPSWQLKNSEVLVLKTKIEDLPKTKKIEFPGLGYKGFRVANRNKILGIPDSIIIFNKTISMRENDEIVFYLDINNVEEWLFNQAREHGYERIVESIIAHRVIIEDESDPLKILKIRLAKGEITKEEYLELLRLLGNNLDR